MCLLTRLMFLMLLAGNTSLLAAPIRVAAASSLQFALAELVDNYSAAALQPVYGASGNLFRQIMQGAPYDVFLSADTSLIEKLQQADRLALPPVEFGHGRLALFKHNRATLRLSPDAAHLGAVMAAKPTFRLSIANPRHAPYGRAAKQALQALGLWELAQPHLVYGEKVSQSAMMVASGAASAGLISLSLAQSPRLQAVGEYVVLDSRLHEPVVLQAMVVANSAQRQAAGQEFLAYLNTDVARQILASYGLQ